MAVEQIITTEWIIAQCWPTHWLSMHHCKFILKGWLDRNLVNVGAPEHIYCQFSRGVSPRSILYQLLLEWRTLYLMQMSGKFYFQLSFIKPAPLHLVLLHKQDQNLLLYSVHVSLFISESLFMGFIGRAYHSSPLALGQAWIVFKSDQSATRLEVLKPAAPWCVTLELPAFHKTSCPSFGW